MAARCELASARRRRGSVRSCTTYGHAEPDEGDAYFPARWGHRSRLGFCGLHALVETQLKQDVLSGHVFVFCNRAHTRIKALTWDGSGLWLCTKRLERRDV